MKAMIDYIVENGVYYDDEQKEIYRKDIESWDSADIKNYHDSLVKQAAEKAEYEEWKKNNS